VLGGIASGKSRVAELLAGPRGVVVDADRLAHEVLDEPAVRERIRARFGADAFGQGGGVDRARLARLVFGDPPARAALEAWVHPRVRERNAAALARARQEGAPRVVLDVPLLLENASQHGLLDLCDRLVFVDAPAEARERRAMAQRGWAAGELARREAAQLPLGEKRARADHVIENDGDQAALAAAVSDLLERLEGTRTGP
jgi:dephospho-CoA kinase